MTRPGVASGPSSDGQGAPPAPGPGTAGPAHMRTLVEQLHRLRAAALEMGGERRVARHHASGRLTARERVELLVDVGSWYEIGLLALPEHRPEDGVGAADGVITGWGEIDGRKVAVVAVDATVLSGTTATVNARKQVALVAAAGRSGTPVVFLADADGGRMPDLLGWRFGGLPLDFRQFLGSPAGSPRVLRLCAALGPCYGDSALQAASADFTVMTETASLALSGPEVVRVATGEQVTHLELGGPEVASATGSASSVVPSEQDAIALLRRVLGYLPDHAGAPAPTVAPVPPQHDPETLLDVVPAERRLAYDVRRLLTSVVDAGTLVEWRRRQGPGLYTALARIEGSPVAIAASQPLHLGGALDVPALEKHLALIELAETFNLPLVLFHDVPGLLIGSDAERQGVLVLLERIATRLSTATVPRIAVVVRKSYGGGYFLMGGNQTSPDLLVCWPSAEMGFMAPEAGVATVHRRRLEDERAARGEGAAQLLHDELLAEWQHESEPWEAAAHFLVDDVIDPRDTREVVRRAIDVTWGSRTRVSSS